MKNKICITLATIMLLGIKIDVQAMFEGSFDYSKKSEESTKTKSNTKQAKDQQAKLADAQKKAVTANPENKGAADKFKGTTTKLKEQMATKAGKTSSQSKDTLAMENVPQTRDQLQDELRLSKTTLDLSKPATINTHITNQQNLINFHDKALEENKAEPRTQTKLTSLQQDKANLEAKINNKLAEIEKLTQEIADLEATAKENARNSTQAWDIGSTGIIGTTKENALNNFGKNSTEIIQKKLELQKLQTEYDKNLNEYNKKTQELIKANNEHIKKQELSQKRQDSGNSMLQAYNDIVTMLDNFITDIVTKSKIEKYVDNIRTTSNMNQSNLSNADIIKLEEGIDSNRDEMLKLIPETTTNKSIRLQIIKYAEEAKQNLPQKTSWWSSFLGSSSKPTQQ